MTNEEMILLNQDIMRIHNARNELESDYVSMQIELPSWWQDSDLEQAEDFRDWLALEAFPEETAEYERRIDKLEKENENLRKAYNEIQEQNKELALKLYDSKKG